MSPEEIKELYNQYFYYILAADILIGLLFGLIPLILGLRRKKRNLAIAGFIASGVIGAFSPLLSILVAVVFIVLIVRNPKTQALTGNNEDLSSDVSGNSPS